MTGTAKKDGHPAPNTNDDCDTHNNRESKSSFYKVLLNDGTEKEDEREPCPGVLHTVAPKLQSGDGALSTLSPSEGLAVAAVTADDTMLTTKAVEVFLEDIGPAKEAEEKQPTTKEVTGVAANAVDAKTSEGTEMQRVVIPGFFEAASLAEKAKGEHLAEEEVATAAATAVATKATKMAITAVPVEAEAAMHPVEGTGEGQMMAEEAAAIATDTAKAQVAEHEEIHDASFSLLSLSYKGRKGRACGRGRSCHCRSNKHSFRCHERCACRSNRRVGDLRRIGRGGKISHTRPKRKTTDGRRSS